MARRSDARGKLLEAAFDLIRASSFNGVGVEEICTRAGVNKGSFYHFFNSKSDLVAAAYELRWQSHQQDLERIFACDRPPLERIMEWWRWIYRSQKLETRERGTVCGCPFASLGAEVATRDEVIREGIERCLSRELEFLEDAIAEAVVAGSVAVDHPGRAAQQIQALILGTLLQARISARVEMLKGVSLPVLALLGAKPSKVLPRA